MLTNTAIDVSNRGNTFAADRPRTGIGEIGPLVGRSSAMRRVIGAIELLAHSSASVMISGESGTGKELVARTIHQLSTRHRAPYVPINCAAIPESLVESELFGHERGSFTGADRRHQGCFEAANGGTLLLDELTEMRPQAQAKLLRVIEEGRLRRVGGSAEIAIDVRVLSASNRNIEQAVSDGLLRADLYYRLNVFTIELPPLRQRIDDLPQLIQLFVEHYAMQNRKDVVGADEECVKALQTHPWPGNVRQLRNVIERALILCDGRFLRIRDLPEAFRVTDSAHVCINVPIGLSLEDVDKEVIMRTIVFAGGNKTRAAQTLGISVKTLYNKLDFYERGFNKASAAVAYLPSAQKLRRREPYIR